MRNMTWKWIAFCSIFVFAIALVMGSSAKPAGKVKLASEFSLQDIKGNTHKLSSYKGKVVLVNFWATWCPPCRQEIPDFIEIQNEMKDKGFVILGISVDNDGAKAVKPFAEKNKINYPMLLADNKVVADYGGIRAIPASFLIDVNGHIVKQWVGIQSKEEMVRDITPLLAAVKPAKPAPAKAPAKPKPTPKKK